MRVDRKEVTGGYLSVDDNGLVSVNGREVPEAIWDDSPVEYYDWSDAKILAVDIETHDPDIGKGLGTSVYRGNGRIIGVSIGDGVRKEYYNLGHQGISEEEREKNYKYIGEVLSLPMPKVGTNIMYDVDWLENWKGSKLKVNGHWYDIVTANALIDEYRAASGSSLDAQAKIYLGEEKQNASTFAYAKSMGWKLGKMGTEREHLHQMPYEIVRDYGKGDADQPLRIFEKQEPILRERDLWEMFMLETRVLPCLLLMRKNGVRVDGRRLALVGIESTDIMAGIQRKLDTLSGLKNFNPNSAKQMKVLFEKQGLSIAYNEPTENMIAKAKKNGEPYPKGNPCFNKDILGLMDGDHEAVTLVLDYRHYKTVMSFFVSAYPKLLVDGRLHCFFYPTKRDDGGTVTGRFSSSKPNLQQVSSKKEDGQGFLRGQIIRKCFIPEDGHEWYKLDWSQIEYRIIAHYAIGPGAQLIKDRYNDNPSTDYHTEVGEMTGLITDPNDSDQRKVTKTLNFGSAYGMGAKTMSAKYGWSKEFAAHVFGLYHAKVPFVRETSKKVGNVARVRGYIKTILGRHCHMPASNKSYVMFNRLIQGSAADIMKMAMVLCYEEGLFGEVGQDGVAIPHLTVHDELDFSCKVPKIAERIKEIMETCVELSVPIKCDAEKGKNWGEVKEIKDGK